MHESGGLTRGAVAGHSCLAPPFSQQAAQLVGCPAGALGHQEKERRRHRDITGISRRSGVYAEQGVEDVFVMQVTEWKVAAAGPPMGLLHGAV